MSKEIQGNVKRSDSVHHRTKGRICFKQNLFLELCACTRSRIDYLSKSSAESAMAEVAINNVWFLSVALVLIPLTGKDGISQYVLSDCR